MMDTALTILKSWSVVWIISFMQGASPISIPPWSYFFRISLSRSIWAFTASLATLYSELMSSKRQLPLFNIEVTDSGRNSSGTREPTTDSMPSTYFTPSTCSIFRAMARTSFADTSAFTSSIWLDATLNSSRSLPSAMTYSISPGRHWPMS